MSLRIKELLYDEMFTIAGAKKKLQAEVREGSKLKIVHPEPRTIEEVKRNDNPSLFENEELELGDLADEQVESSDLPTSLNANQRHALRSLASQLLELREMLKISKNGSM